MKLEPEPLPADLARSLDRVSRGILLWDPALGCFLRERCQGNAHGQSLLKHRGRLYLCVTKPEEIKELLHPSIDVLVPWPRESGPVDPFPGRGPGIPEIRTAPLQFRATGLLRDQWQQQCKNHWHAGALLSLPREARIMANLLLEDLGLLPDPLAEEDRRVAEETLTRVRRRAFLGDPDHRGVISRKWKPGWSPVLPQPILGRHDGEVARREAVPGRRSVELYWLSQAGPELELAILAALLVFVEQGGHGAVSRFPSEQMVPGWIRYALAECWRLLPPRWIQGRITCHECRLGTDRIPPGVVLLFCPRLLEGAMDFEHFEPVPDCTHERPPRNPEEIWGEIVSPLASRVLDGINILFEEIFAHYRLGPVSGQEDWELWKRRDMRVLTSELPFHVT